MKNTSTTLEIPEGSKATIQGKVIDGKNYLVVEMENEEQAPEWTKFKRGDVLIYPDPKNEIFVIFDEYMNNSNHACFSCIFNVTSDENTMWMTNMFRKATKEEEKRFFKWLREERGLEWNGEKLVEVPRKGDMCIFWDSTPCVAIIAVYGEFKEDENVHYDHRGMCWDNALKWDGTKEQYKKVLRGELKKIHK